MGTHIFMEKKEKYQNFFWTKKGLLGALSDNNGFKLEDDLGQNLL